MRNRFKGLDLFCDIVQGDREQGHPQEKEMQKKQNGYLRRPYKQLWKEEKQKEQERKKNIPIWMQSSKE